MSFLDNAKIKAIDLMKQAYAYLSKTYGTNGSVFTPSSPTGQILNVVSHISELIFLYIDRVSSELNITKAQSRESIQGLARLTGHDSFRGTASSGICTLRLNPSKRDNVYGNSIKINNGSIFTIEECGNQYFLNLENDYITLNYSNNEPIYVEYIQGIKCEQTFVSSGEKLQSYNVNTKGMTDHNRVKVFVNNEEWKRVDSLYDMNYNEKCYMIKTSINMGMSIFFGNVDFGCCPESGKPIRVEYINHIGNDGDVSGENLHFKFSSYGIDERGDNVDLNNVLSITVEKSPSMGTNHEPLEFTRRIAPYMSKSFVLANPQNYVSFLGKYSQYTLLEAYNTKDDSYIEDDNVVYLRMIPNIKNKVSNVINGNDYFDINENEFILSDTDKYNILKTISDSGRQLISSEVVIEDIKIKRYALVIAIKYYERYDKNKIWSDVRTSLSNYFLNINRTDFIPKSDIISIVENIDGVDSVNAYFISEENEEAIKNGFYIDKIEWINPLTHLRETITKKVELKDGEDPRLGLDSFGDIKLNKNEIAIIKGGWSDRFNNSYDIELKANTLCGLSLLFNDEVRKK